MTTVFGFSLAHSYRRCWSTHNIFFFSVRIEIHSSNGKWIKMDLQKTSEWWNNIWPARMHTETVISVRIYRIYRLYDDVYTTIVRLSDQMGDFHMTKATWDLQTVQFCRQRLCNGNVYIYIYIYQCVCVLDNFPLSLENCLRPLNLFPNELMYYNCSWWPPVNYIVVYRNWRRK